MLLDWSSLCVEIEVVVIFVHVEEKRTTFLHGEGYVVIPMLRGERVMILLLSDETKELFVCLGKRVSTP